MSRSARLFNALALTAAAAGLSSSSSAFAQEPGSIKGRVVWAGAVAPAAKVLVEKGKATKDPEVCGLNGSIESQELVVDPETKGVANVVVYLLKPAGSNPAAAEALLKAHPKAVLDQKDCVFLPHVQAIYQEQPLTIKTSDPVSHNVRYQGFTNGALNQMLGAGAKPLEVKLKAERRPMQVACDIHPWMTSWVAVFDHPYFAVTDKTGAFEIKGVPAGSQNLIAWQEKAGYINEGKAKGTPVVVKAGAAADAGTIKLEPTALAK